MNAQSIFRYQPSVAVSGSVGGKVLVVDDVLSSHEQQIYPTTSLDEKGIEVEFQFDRNNCTDWRQTYLSLVLELVKHRGVKKVESKEVKKEYNEAEVKKAVADDDNEVPVITHVNNIMHSIFSNVDVYLNNQQVHNSKGFMLKHPTFPKILKEPSLCIRECYIVKAMTLKQIQKTLLKIPLRIHSFQGE